MMQCETSVNVDDISMITQNHQKRRKVDFFTLEPGLKFVWNKNKIGLAEKLSQRVSEKKDWGYLIYDNSLMV